MKITGVNNITTNFKGLLVLHSTIIHPYSGFPTGPDYTDVFVYEKFKDESIEDEEADSIKLNSIKSYTFTTKVSDDVYVIEQVNSKICKSDEPIDFTHDEFKTKEVNPQLKKRLVDLSEVDENNLIGVISNIKDSTSKEFGGIGEDGSLLFNHE